MLAVCFPFWDKQVPKYWHQRWAAVISLLYFLCWLAKWWFCLWLICSDTCQDLSYTQGDVDFPITTSFCFVLVTFWTCSRFLRTVFKGGKREQRSVSRRDIWKKWGNAVVTLDKVFWVVSFPCLVNVCTIRCAESMEQKRGPGSIT